MASPDITIIIPTKNAGKFFYLTLASIFEQRISRPFEVVVVDSGSHDETIDICGKFPVKLYKIPPEDFGHAKTRNFGVSLSKAEYLVFLVQDAVPADKEWLANLLKPLEKDLKIAGSYSRNIPSAEASRRQAIEMERYYPVDARLQSTVDDHIFSNVSSAIRGAIIREIPFPDVVFGEDQFWAKRVLEAGYNIKYEASSMVIHSHRYKLKTAYQRGQAEGLWSRAIGEAISARSDGVIILAAFFEMLKWLIKGDFKSCAYSAHMLAWIIGFRRGFHNNNQKVAKLSFL